MTGHCGFLNAPLESDRVIWRYVDLAKFLDLLEREQLYFPRIDALEDAFEGVVQRDLFTLGSDEQSGPHEGHSNVRANVQAFIRESTFVSCWHANESESEAMWKLYSREGIAIRSTIARLMTGLQPADDVSITVDAVRYLDYSSNPVIVTTNGLEAVMSKRISFEHEREVRAAILTPPPIILKNGESHVDLGNPEHPKGLYVPVDVETLVEQVYVSPKRPAWFRELVLSLVRRYGFSGMEVVASSLDERPDLT